MNFLVSACTGRALYSQVYPASSKVSFARKSGKGTTQPRLQAMPSSALISPIAVRVFSECDQQKPRKISPRYMCTMSCSIDGGANHQEGSRLGGVYSRPLVNKRKSPFGWATALAQVGRGPMSICLPSYLKRSCSSEPFYAKPTYDVAFKKLFADPKHQERLISFINSALGLEEQNQVKEVKIQDSQRLPITEDSKLSIVDVLAVDMQGRQFIVEIQVSKQPFFAKRALFYASSVYSQQLPKSSRYDKLKGVFFIGVLEFQLPGKNLNDFFSHYKLTEKNSGLILTDSIELLFIELPKFEKILTQDMTILDKWIYLLKHAEELQDVPPEFKDQPELIEALETLAMHKWTREERLDYLRYEMALGAQNDALQGAQTEGLEKGLERGRAEGLEKGLEKGLERGRAEGLEKGLEKGRVKQSQEIALELLKRNTPIEDIVEITKLSEKEILELKFV